VTTKIPLISQTAKQKGQNLHFQKEIWTKRMIIYVRVRCFIFYKSTSANAYGFYCFRGLFCHFFGVSNVFSAQKTSSSGSSASRKGLPARLERGFSPLSDCCFCSKTTSFSCRKGLIALQRSRNHHVTTAPLQCNKALTADQRGSYGKAVAA